MRKIVVMGGSFNPPTIAHQRLLLGAVKELGAEDMLHPKGWEILMENGGMRK